nr:TspO/MBR family protein [Marinicella rhabdoformis]
MCFAASFVGAMATFNAADTYSQLTQPSWAPPGWLFGPVWTALYALMAVSVWLVWRQTASKPQRLALVSFLIQLVLNGLWSWLFFAWSLGLGPVINIVLLWIAIAVNIVLFWRVNRVAAVLMLPYILWVTFATVLNFAMWQLNTELFY